MMKLIVATQYLENYGFVDGGEAWKFKGGSEYEVAYFSYNEIAAMGARGVAEVADFLAREYVDYSNPASQEYMVDYYLLDDGELTGWEQDQLEFEGSITSPREKRGWATV